MEKRKVVGALLCPNCERENSQDARFCDHCGFPISGAINRGSKAASPSKSKQNVADLAQGRLYDRDSSAAEAEPSNEPNIKLNSEEEFDEPSGWPFHNKDPREGLLSVGKKSKKNVPVSIGSIEDFSKEEKETISEEFSWNDKKYKTKDDEIIQSLNNQSEFRSRINTTKAKAVGFFGERQEASNQNLNPDATQAMDLDALGSVSEIIQSPAFAEIMATEYPHLNPQDLDFEDDPFADRFDELLALPEDYTDIPSEYGGAYQPVFDLRSDAMKMAESGSDASSFNSSCRPDSPFEETRNAFARPSRAQKQRPPKDTAESSREIPRPARKSSRKTSLEMGPEKVKKPKALMAAALTFVIAGVAIVLALNAGIIGGVAVPNVLGQSQEDALATLEASGFSAKAMAEPSDEVEGRVLSTKPTPGSFAPQGSEVMVAVSAARTIPDIVGKSYDTAKEALEAEGYKNIKFVNQLTNEPENIVMAVNPAPGSRAKSTMEVTVTIAQNFKVPDVINMSIGEAKSAIDESGLNYKISYVDSADYPDGTVLEVTPAVGTKMNKGEIVELKVSRTRGIELMALAETQLSPGNTLKIGDQDYSVESIASLSYDGDDVVSFTISAKPFVTLFGEKLFASASQNLTGKIKFSSNNEIQSIS